jgi:hypothetical protein
VFLCPIVFNEFCRASVNFFQKGVAKVKKGGHNAPPFNETRVCWRGAGSEAGPWCQGLGEKIGS